ncbi:MAG: hypothetical protein IAC08_01010 [Bacteroidetes bacterium]|uniref:TonB C-terminal domain-containing protein n=1 Tax=Candidatus Cryptobacteroides intestinigallinarum TaxID=2840767 RepID=A0A9D9MZ30_9BACT|nr:hypothetical protein [Candidatus Cryptobacteroides intestinigallinarum]
MNKSRFIRVLTDNAFVRYIRRTFVSRIGRLKKEDKAGFYITVIFHLAVIIVLLAGGLTAALRGESSFMMDFSKQEAEEKIRKESEFKEEISRRLDELIYGDAAPAPSASEIRNIAVDASSPLKDDRNTDADKLYEDAERLRQDLTGSRNPALQDEDMRNDAVDLGQESKKNKDHDGKEYKGPSVVSYNLDGRKASRLSIPAYRCIGGGDVTVIITVDNAGYVVNAKVLEEVSSSDRCLQDFAVRAARMSRFSSSSSAPLKQRGEIVYRFIPQE